MRRRDHPHDLRRPRLRLQLHLDQRAATGRATEFRGRPSSVYLTGMVGGIVIGSALGGATTTAWGLKFDLEQDEDGRDVLLVGKGKLFPSSRSHAPRQQAYR